MTAEQLVEARRTLKVLQDACRGDKTLLKDQYSDAPDEEYPLSGYCYILAESMYYLHPGMFTIHRIRWADGDTHWFLRDAQQNVWDCIQDGKPVCTPQEYNSAQWMRSGFLNFTKNKPTQPSKRCQRLLQKAGLRVPIDVVGILV